MESKVPRLAPRFDTPLVPFYGMGFDSSALRPRIFISDKI